MRIIDRAWLVLAATAAAMAVPTEAEACSVAPGVWKTTPDDGGQLPEGSGLFLEGALEPQALFLTVDDQPAELVADPDFPQRGFGSGYYRVDPIPAEGSTVVLRQCFSYDDQDCENGDTWTWTVTAPDDQTSPPAESLEYGIYDHRDVDTYGDSCGSGAIIDVTIYVHFDVPADAAPGAARLALVEVVDAEDGRVWGDTLLDIDPAGESIDTRLSFNQDTLRRPLSESVCVEVTTFDLAGNYADTVSRCIPQNVGADPEQTPNGEDYGPPEEPDWGELVDPDELGDRGCSCRANQEREGGRMASLLLVLLGLRLRSRRRG